MSESHSFFKLLSSQFEKYIFFHSLFLTGPTSSVTVFKLQKFLWKKLRMTIWNFGLISKGKPLLYQMLSTQFICRSLFLSYKRKYEIKFFVSPLNSIFLLGCCFHWKVPFNRLSRIFILNFSNKIRTYAAFYLQNSHSYGTSKFWKCWVSIRVLNSVKLFFSFLNFFLFLLL